MKSALEIIRGELERLFSNNNLKELCTDYLGFDPEEEGLYSETKTIFVRQLVEWCDKEQATEALTDAVILLKKGMADPRLKQIYETRYPVAELATGDEVNGFVIEKSVTSGGLGQIYQCKRKDSDDSALYGMKVIHAEHTLDGYAVQRFLTLMRILKTEISPAVQKTEEVGLLADGRPFVVTEWIEGASLSDRAPLSCVDALTILEKVVDSLENVHNRGFVHADLNAENVLIRTNEDDDFDKLELVLLGFGVHRLFHRSTPRMSGKSVYGNFCGLAPEQARGVAPDVRSDIYALGAMLYNIISGQVVFDGNTALDIVAAHLNDDRKELSEILDEPVPTALDDFISKMMAKDPLQRPQTLDDVRRLIEDAKRSAEEMAVRAAQTGTRDDIETWADALIETPEDEEILNQLQNDAKQFNAWGPAIEIMEEAALATEDKDVARRLLLCAADAAVSFIKNYDKAREIYNQFIEADPADEGVNDALVRLLKSSGQYEELIEKLVARAESAEDPDKRFAIIGEIADVYENNLKEYGPAFDYCLACLNGAVVNEQLVNRLESLAGRTDRFADLATACAAAAQTAETAANEEAVIFYFERTGSYYLEKIDEAAYALTCFQKILEIQPSHTVALKAMVDLYRGAQQWNELAEILVRLGEVEQTPSLSRDHKVEAAKIYYKRLSDSKESLSLLEEVSKDDPAHNGAIDMLTEIYQTSKEWKKLAGLLSSSVEALPENEEQIKVRLHLGELYEDRLDNTEKAQDQFEKVLLIDGHHLDAIKGLERIFALKGNAAALRDNLATQLEISVTPKQRVLLLERLADICEEEFKDYDKAIEHLKAILEIENEHVSSRIFLTRLYRKTERWEDLVEMLAIRAKDASDDDKCDMLTERAEILREDIKDAQRAAEAFAEVAALGADGALVTLAKTQEDAGDYESAVKTLKQMIADTDDTEAKVSLLVRVATTQHSKLEDTDAAVATLNKARDLAPDDRAILAQSRTILIDQGNYSAAMDTLEKESELVEGSKARAVLFAQMGVICIDNLDDEERAMKNFEQALELDESNFMAGDRCSEIYRMNNDWEKALPIYERWADAAATMTVEKQVELFTQMGEAYDQLDRHDDALKVFAKASEIAGDNIDLVKRLGEVALNLEAWDLAKRELSKYLDMASDSLTPEEKIDVFVKLGRACMGVEDFAEAGKLVRQATVMSPDHQEARLLLADVNEQRGDFRGMVDALTRVLAKTDKDSPERIPLLRRTAGTLFENLKDADGASGMLKEALEIDSGDRAVLGDLLKIYSATKHFNDLIEVVLRIAKLVDDKNQKARYYLTAAKIYRRELKETQKAISYFETAQEEDPTLIDAQEAIVEILTAEQDWEKLEAFYKKTISLLPKDADSKTRLAVYVPFSDLLIDKLDKQRDGILITEAIAALEPDNLVWKEKLSDLYGWEKQYISKAVTLHRNLLEANPARVDSFRQLYRIFSSDEDPDRAWCAASLLALLNQASPEERTYYREYQPEDLPTLENRLHDEQWSRLLYHGDMNQTISSVFSVIFPAIYKIKSQAHAQYGVNEKDAIDVTNDDSQFSAFVNFAAGALGIKPPPVFFHSGQESGFALINTRPPAFVADNKSSALRDRMGIAFSLGQDLTFLRPGLLINRLISSGTELSSWLLASIKTFVPTLPVPPELAGPVSERLEPLRSSLSDSDMERLQGHVQSFIAKSADVNLKRWARSVTYTRDRAGLLLCGDIAVAVRMMKTQITDKALLSDRLRALTLFTTSDEHFALRDHLGTSLKNG
jgi:tetratricopeptide (TPR) repeat protein/serine/threonine protein kinase